MDERWRVIPGFDGIYELSDEGRVRSWQRVGFMKESPKEPHILKPRRSKNGQVYVKLGGRDGTNRAVRSLMRDVWMKGKIPGYVVHSKNNVKSDCPLRNLEYTTKQSITKSGRGNRRAVMRLENGMVTRIYKSGREAAKAEHLTPSGMRRRIQRGTIVDGVQFIYGD